MSNFSNQAFSLKYNDLIRQKELESSIELCLSEFIDNSISSFMEDEERSKQEELFITINFWKNPNNSYYEIIDNANGIIPNNIRTCMERFPHQYENKNSLNQYGVGMKFAMFWLGSDGLLLTRAKNHNIYKGDYNSTHSDLTDSVVPLIKEIDLTKDKEYLSKFPSSTGTIIVVKDVHKNRGISNANIDSIKEFLGYRYNNYLKGEDSFKVNIEIKLFVNNILNMSVIIEPNNILDNSLTTLNINKLLLNKSNKEEYINLRKEKIYSQNITNPKFERIKYLFEDFYNDKPLIYKDELINFNESNQTFPISWKILDAPSKNYSGVAIKQKDRYIFHPATSKNSITKLYQWSMENDSEKWKKWLYAEIDITKLPNNENLQSIKPDQNKNKIIDNDISSTSTNPISVDNLNASLNAFSNRLIPFLEEIKNINNEKNSTTSSTNELNNNVTTLINANSSIEEIISNDNNVLEITNPYNNNIVKVKYDDFPGENWILKVNPDDPSGYIFNRESNILKNNCVNVLFVTLTILMDQIIRTKDIRDDIQSLNYLIDWILKDKK